MRDTKKRRKEGNPFVEGGQHISTGGMSVSAVLLRLEAREHADDGGIRPGRDGPHVLEDHSPRCQGADLGHPTLDRVRAKLIDEHDDHVWRRKWRPVALQERSGDERDRE
jgi:hypothetical protein